MPEYRLNAAGRAWMLGAEGWKLAPQSGPSQLPPFDPAPAASANSGLQLPVDLQRLCASHRPRLIALPNDGDGDLLDPATILASRGLPSAQKVAGVRQKGKHNKRHHSSDSDSDHVWECPMKKGQPKGIPNFNSDETTKLLDLVEKLCPMGQRGWVSVEKKYNKWAAAKGRPERDVKSLEDRYKRVHHN
ncbi:hypothetical protein B0H10DRAFT_2209564 [Mycena sp. CBHHK59/15]|nr:hypothetical protein B0H10DRAFT_2209564 [Mycena sp. CBHHK59/15]